MSVLSPIEVPKGKHVLRVLDNTGHTDVIYDPTIDVEVEEAMATFDESMGKGMSAYVLTDDGGGSVTRTFDKTAEQVVLVPQTVGG
jgi:hypothetical protein